MAERGQLGAEANGQVLRWPGRVVSAEELRRTLNGHRELIVPTRAVITPSALEHLRQNGIQVRRQAADEKPAAASTWAYAQDRPAALVKNVVQSLAREGIPLKEMECADDREVCHWARLTAECVGRGDCRGAVVFCEDGGLVCCLANKVPGLRASAVRSIAQAGRAAQMLGANLVAVEMPGPTFFEVRQILRTICGGGNPNCPPAVATALQECDGHAHR
jgi:ribose 5-phosphate isomerase RpiB